jgi:hypothetical protein
VDCEEGGGAKKRREGEKDMEIETKALAMVKRR